MERRILRCATLALAIAFAGCAQIFGFDKEYREIDGASAETATTGSSTSAATAAGAGGAGGTTQSATSSGSGGAGGQGGVGACMPGDCTDPDKDGDGHGDPDCVPGAGGAGGEGGAGGVIAWDDCDDCNADVRPGQTSFFTDPRPDGGGFDYDCDGISELQYTSVIATCSGQSGCGKYGVFLNGVIPDCGESDILGNCELVSMVCTKTGAMSVVQGCR